MTKTHQPLLKEAETGTDVIIPRTRTATRAIKTLTFNFPPFYLLKHTQRKSLTTWVDTRVERSCMLVRSTNAEIIANAKVVFK